MGRGAPGKGRITHRVAGPHRREVETSTARKPAGPAPPNPLGGRARLREPGGDRVAIARAWVTFYRGGVSDLYPHALGFAAYRDNFDADYARFREVAPAALAVPVPECGGWTGEDAVRHLAQVYLHKAESIRTGVMPGGGWPPAWLAERPALEVLDECHAGLQAEFDGHNPSDAAATWFPEDQTVGFWIRRMAHETAVHRRDVESAAGSVTGVDALLAVDGIDEVLALMLAGDWSTEVIAEATGATVGIESAGCRWEVTLNPAEVLFRRAAAGAADETEAAIVFGGPGDVLLWLWGRAPLPGFGGNADAVAELRARLALATQ